MTDTPSKDQMRDSILRLIREQGHATFVDIESLPGGRGPHDYLTGRNLVFWQAGLSTPAAEALVEMKAAEDVYFLPCLVEVYIAAGRVLDLPVAPLDQPEKLAAGLASPHWVPVAITDRLPDQYAGGGHG